MDRRITFDGSFVEYFIISLALLFLGVITLGLALPYYSYWSLKYFFTKMRVGDRKITFTGGFGEYFLTALGLLVLSLLTLGLALPYFGYWSFKYFFRRLELAPDGTQAAVSARVPHVRAPSTQHAAPLSPEPPVTAAPAAEPAIPPSPRGDVASQWQPPIAPSAETARGHTSAEEQAPPQYQFGSPR